MKWVQINSEWAIFFLFPFSCRNKRWNNIALMLSKKFNIPSELKSIHFFFEKLMKVANEKNVCHISLLNCLSLFGKISLMTHLRFPFMILTENWLLRPHSEFLIWSQSKLCTVLCEFRTWFSAVLCGDARLLIIWKSSDGLAPGSI